MNSQIDIVLHHQEALLNSEEFRFGLGEMKLRLPSGWRHFNVDCRAADSVEKVLETSSAESLLVILDPALIMSDNLAEGLQLTDSELPAGVTCLLPNDPRATGLAVAPDYVTRPGFDRYVARLSAQSRYTRYDGREPWVFMVKRTAVEELVKEKRDIFWADIPVLLRTATAVAQHVFVHSYADYYFNDRVEMLDLLPKEVDSLLDIGGGEGRFAHAFATQRSGRATLVEQNHEAAFRARSRGVQVVEGDFLSAQFCQLYDCVSLLDVLEHMVDPQKTLEKVRNLLNPGGCLLLSVPNVGHWSVVADLLAGRFDYQPVGILCNTHLRFFTAHSLQLLLEKARFEVRQWRSVRAPLPEDFQQYLSASVPGWLVPDSENLAADCFHVLASPQ